MPKFVRPGELQGGVCWKLAALLSAFALLVLLSLHFQGSTPLHQAFICAAASHTQVGALRHLAVRLLNARPYSLAARLTPLLLLPAGQWHRCCSRRARRRHVRLPATGGRVLSARSKQFGFRHGHHGSCRAGIPSCSGRVGDNARASSTTGSGGRPGAQRRWQSQPLAGHLQI